MKHNFRTFCSLVVMLAAVRAAAQKNQPASAIGAPHEQVVKIVLQIQRADYEDDRIALQHLYGELTPFAENKDLASRVRYWRGFALWRRALNGFIDSADPKELEGDLRQAVTEFDESAAKDPGFADAKIGALSCVSNLVFLNQRDPARLQELLAQKASLQKDAEALSAENPRLFWVLGPNFWYAPPQYGGSQAKALEMYQKGLDAIRRNKPTARDPLEPTWGEAELLTNLAWSNLHRTTPDLNAAEQFAHSALDMVPYWHSVQDILLPQIEEAKKKQKDRLSG